MPSSISTACSSPAITGVAKDFLTACRAPRERTIREFAEQELILPDGPYQGRRFRVDRQPFTAHYLAAIDSGRWLHFNATGPSQSGKTMLACNLPLLYHLFETKDTVVFGLPDLATAGDKWRESLEPALRRTQFNRHRPTTGPGSRGGVIRDAIQFLNGSTLRFMTGGGGDKQRAHFTARIVIVTESDGLDEPGAASRETSKIRQLFARSRAFSETSGRPAQRYTECTVSTEDGYTWQTDKLGSGSRIYVPCPACGDYVLPERDQLIGWQQAESELQAREQAGWSCPACSRIWSEAERKDMNAAGRTVHRGQTIDSQGRIDGPEPETRTFSLRWSAFHNLFVPPDDIAADEWNAMQQDDNEQADRELCQFVYAVPPKPRQVALVSLDSRQVQARSTALPRGILPADCSAVSVGVDIGKRLAHWVVLGWHEHGIHVADYGLQEIDTDRLDLLRATRIALEELADYVQAGWLVDGSTKQQLAGQVWIDAGWQDSAPAVYDFCRQQVQADGISQERARYRPTRGYGMGSNRASYRSPKRKNRQTIWIDKDGACHFTYLKAAGLFLVELDANFWKSFIHDRLHIPRDEQGAVTLFNAPAAEHTKFSKHMVSESKQIDMVPGRGPMEIWKRVNRNNHWLDAICLAAAAGQFIQQITGQALGQPADPAPQQVRATPRPGASRMHTPDGRPYFILDR